MSNNPVPSILLYGTDESLMETRAWVIERAGLKVRRTRDGVEVRRSIAEDRIDLLILCHTLTTQEVDRVLDEAHRQPASHTLVLSAHVTDFPETAQDAVLSAFSGPHTLITKVLELVAHQPQ